MGMGIRVAIGKQRTHCVLRASCIGLLALVATFYGNFPCNIVRIARAQSPVISPEFIPAPSPASQPVSPNNGAATFNGVTTSPASRVPGEHVIGFPQPASDNVVVENVDGGVSIVVRDAPLSEVLSALAEAKNLNLVLAAPATQPITLSLSKRSLTEALDAVLASGGLQWHMRGDIIYVTGLSATVPVSPEVQGRQLAVFELDYASAEDIDQAVKGLLSPVGKSWIAQTTPQDSRRTKEIVTVEDLPRYLHRIEDYIAQLDQPPRQVLIEVQVLQIDLNDDDRHGVDLSQIARMGGVEVNFSTAGLANLSAPQAFFMRATAANMAAMVEALKTTTDAKTLASPRIIALNGQEARIQVGQQLGFRVTTTTETSTLESVEFLNVGVVLTVTPHIARDGRVLMRIRPEVSSGSVNPTTGLPEEDTTEVETDILLSSGQGMVIGGLIQENDNVSANKYLGLGDLRFVGPLFQRRQEIKGRSEIIVALTPHVIPLADLTPEKERDQFNLERVREPLFVGALQRFPRPYEARLPDYKLNPQPPKPHLPPAPPTCARIYPVNSAVEYPVEHPVPYPVQYSVQTAPHAHVASRNTGPLPSCQLPNAQANNVHSRNVHSRNAPISHSPPAARVAANPPYQPPPNIRRLPVVVDEPSPYR